MRGLRGFRQSLSRRLPLVAIALAVAACSSQAPNPENLDENGSEEVAAPAPEGVAPEGAETAATEVPSTLTNQKEEPSESPVAASTEESGGGTYRGSRKVEVATQPQQADGFWLNAYYFARTGDDSWEKLSNLLYGRPDRAQLLQKWNHDEALGVGQIVYYNSPLRPEDSSSVKIFAEDFGAALETVEVKAGDTLSKLAAAHYGSAQSWREIAAANPELSNPDMIQVGQSLKLQPAEVNTKVVLDKLIAQATQVEQAKAVEAPVSAPTSNVSATAPPVNTMPADLMPSPPVNDTAAVTKVEAAPKSKFSADLLLKIGLVLVLIGAGLVIYRRRAARQPLTTWDESANVTKLSQTKPGF